MAFPQAVRPTTAKTGKSSETGKTKSSGGSQIGRKVVGTIGRHGQVKPKIIKAAPVAIKEVLMQQIFESEDARLLVLDTLCMLCQDLSSQVDSAGSAKD